MAIPDTPWYTLPCKFPAISANFQIVTKLLGLIFITHESQEGHVNGRRFKMECLKVQAELTAKAVEDLNQMKELQGGFKYLVQIK